MQLVKRIFRKGEMIWTKTLCLGVGMALGLLALSEAIYQRQYDGYVPRAEDTYRIEPIIHNSETGELLKDWVLLTGGLTPEFARYCPYVEASTRYTYLWDKGLWRTDDNRILTGEALVVDTDFFRLFPRKLIIGQQPEKVFGETGKALISESLYRKLGKDGVGKKLIWDINRKLEVEVIGVYEDFPGNSQFADRDILIGQRNILKVWNIPEEFLTTTRGGQNFIGYVRLKPGTDVRKAEAYFKGFLRHIGNEEKEEDYRLILRPLTDIYMNSGFNRLMNYGLFVLGSFVLAIALLNFLLLTFSSTINRAKAIATYRCYGAQDRDIARMISTETLCTVGLLGGGIALSLLMVLGARMDLFFGHTIGDLFQPSVLLSLSLLSVVLLLLVGMITAAVYLRIPVSFAYRRYTETKKSWKLGLLFIQMFIVSAFLCTVLILALQYDKLTTIHLGFDRERVVYFPNMVTSAADDERMEKILNENPNVASYCWANQDLTQGMMRGSISDDGQLHSLGYVGILRGGTKDYVRTLGMTIREGKDFDPEYRDSSHYQILVSESLAKQWKNISGGQSILNRFVYFGEKNRMGEVVGVYQDIRTGSLLEDVVDNGMTVLICQQGNLKGVCYIRLKNNTPQVLDALRQAVREVYNNPSIEVKSLSEEFNRQYLGLQQMRNLVGVSCISILIILLIGVVAYMRDEVNRHRTAIAIRIIHGAEVSGLQRIFITELLKIIFPALLLGILIAWYISRSILEIFVEKIDLEWYLFVLPALLLCMMVVGLAVFLIQQVSRMNPIENIKTE